MTDFPARFAPLQLQALGTHWWIEPLDHEFSAATSQLITVVIRQFEQAYSRFRPESLLGILHDTKQLANPPLEMVDMLRFGLDMYQRSDGLFNMSVGAKLEQLGYGKQSDDDARISSDLLRDITVSTEVVTIAQHVRLDFGGFGKGWLIDKIGAQLQAQGHDGFIINGGGDILVRADVPTEVVLEHPYDKTLGIGAVRLKHGSIAGSSGQKRMWTALDGAPAHHIISPGTGLSGGSAASVHVCAQNGMRDALLADTLGTVLLLAGSQQRQKLAADFNVTYLVIDEQLQFYVSHGFPGTMYV